MVRVVGGVGVLAFLMGGVLLYLLLKYRRRINPFREYIGTGDGVFLLCLTLSIDGVRSVFDYCLCTNFNDLDFRPV